MIQAKKSKTEKVVKPYYNLTFDYMIGDSDGNATEEVYISLDNPYLERFIKLAESLKPIKGYWGVSLEEDILDKQFEEGQLTEDDYQFLKYMMFEQWDEYENKSTFVVEKENEKYASEFWEGVQSDTDYSFLSFLGFTLFYIDEYGNCQEMEVV